VVTRDDATRASYSALLVEEEGTLSSSRGIAMVIDKRASCFASSTPTIIAIRTKPACGLRKRD
jgi:hypothetical protein